MPDSPTPSPWSRPASGPQSSAAADANRSGASDWRAGAVTRLGTPPPAAPPVPPLGQPPGATPPYSRPQQDRRRLWWFGGAAGGVLVTGVVVVLALVLSGADPFRDMPAAPTDVRPPLARLCPASTGPPAEEPPATTDPQPAEPTPVPAGARTVDREAGISYKAYGAPWLPWNTVWSAGTLNVPYKMGQHFITEHAYDGFSDYHASILSAAVPAAENDALTFNLECVGRQVAADVRAEYYPQPTRMELLRDERTTLGGRPAWVTVFRLHFSRPGLKATDELAAVTCVDVGKSTAAVLYVSIPGTHRHFDWIVDDALASVRPT